MESITYSNIAQITGGKANTIEDFPVTGVETDSAEYKREICMWQLSGQRQTATNY